MFRGGVLAVAATALSLGAIGGAAQAQDASQVFVVHGIPDQPVDVYVNDELTISDFQPGQIEGPLELPAGSYDVALTAPGDSVDNALVTATAEVPAGENLSLVAHLTEAGEPTLTPFVNDVSEVPAGQARLTVRHTAAAPAVDVRADGSPIVTDLTNPNEATTEVPAGTVSADVVLAGTEDVVIGPADLTLDEGTVTIVYAIGSAEDGTLELLVQTLDSSGEMPGGAPGREPGALPETGVSTGWLLALAGGLLVAGAVARFAVGRRFAASH